MINHDDYRNILHEYWRNKNSDLSKFIWNNFELESEEIRENANKMLCSSKNLSVQEKELLNYINEFFYYKPKELHKLFEKRKNFQRFKENFHRSSHLNREQKTTIKIISDRQFEYAFTIYEVEIFSDIFVNEKEAQKIIREVIAIAIEREKTEQERINKYQAEIPQARTNVKIIENKIIKFDNKYPSLYKNLKKHISKKKVSFIFQENLDVNHAILQYLSQYAIFTKKLSLEPIIANDDNENYIVTFSLEDNMEIVQFLFSLFPVEEIYVSGLPISTIISHCKLNSVPLVGSWPVDSTDIYYNFRTTTLFPLFNNNNMRPVARNRKIISEESIRTVIDDLKKTYNFETDLDLAIFMYYTLQKPLKLFNEKRERYLTNSKYFSEDNNNNFKSSKKKYLEKAIEKGYYKTKWKSELKLYESIKKIYPSAIYQYRSEWLGKQSLDIFIPDMSIGIEYQGRQHYEPIEFFGGVKAFEDRVYRDNRKKMKCKENNVRLLEWKYNEVITKSHIKKRITWLTT